MISTAKRFNDNRKFNNKIRVEFREQLQKLCLIERTEV